MLALDLLLHSMVFINTLILQQMLEKPEWHETHARLEPVDLGACQSKRSLRTRHEYPIAASMIKWRRRHDCLV
jgi:hypothetical protein